MDRLRAMEIFIRVVESGSMTKAAEMLSLQKSAVSMAIKQLERHLNTRLMHRSTRQFTLTDDGRAYYDRCSAVVAEINAIENSVGSNLDNPSGRIRVDMPSSIAASLVLPNLSDFTRRYPSIQIALGISDRRVDLVRDAVDCVIRTGELQDSTLMSRRIGAFDWIVCGSPDYLEKHGAPTSLAELTQHRVVGYFESGAEFRDVWTFKASGHEQRVALESGLSVNDTPIYVACGLEGHGLIRVADYLADPLIEAGSMIEVLREFRGDPVPIFALYPTARHLSPCVRLFVDWVVEVFEMRGRSRAQVMP